jgi:hypothetical protein
LIKFFKEKKIKLAVPKSSKRRGCPFLHVHSWHFGASSGLPLFFGRESFPNLSITQQVPTQNSTAGRSARKKAHRMDMGKTGPPGQRVLLFASYEKGEREVNTVERVRMCERG